MVTLISFQHNGDLLHKENWTSSVLSLDTGQCCEWSDCSDVFPLSGHTGLIMVEVIQLCSALLTYIPAALFSYKARQGQFIYIAHTHRQFDVLYKNKSSQSNRNAEVYSEMVVRSNKVNWSS